MMSAMSEREVPPSDGDDPMTAESTGRVAPVAVMDDFPAPAQHSPRPTSSDFIDVAIVDGIDSPSRESPAPLAEPSEASAANILTRAVSGVTSRIQAMVRNASSAVPPPLIRPAVLIVGDSITEEGAATTSGWVSMLAAALYPNADVLPRGSSGYNSAWAMHILPREVEGVDPRALRIVVIFFGANDAVFPPGQQAVELEQYRLNLSRMILYVRERSCLPVLITPPPLDTAMEKARVRGENNPGRRTAERSAKYSQACLAVANNHNVPVIDFYGRLMAISEGQEERSGPAKYLRDGLHLNEEGNRVLGEEAIRIIRTHLPFDPESKLPDYKEIDPSSPGALLGPLSGYA